MFGTDHSKLNQIEITTGLHNVKVLNQQAMVAFRNRQKDMESIHAKGPLSDSDRKLVRECVNYVMREMIAHDLNNRLKHKTNRIVKN